MGKAKKAKVYAVAAGRSPGIYSTWAECERQVKGFSGAKFKSFATREEASAFVAQGADSGAQVTQSAPAPGAAVPSGSAGAGTASDFSKRRRLPANCSAPTAAKRPRNAVSSGSNDNQCKGVVINVFFDGGSRGNPGVAGAGAVVTRQVGGEETSQVVKIRQYCGPSSTNNVAEYTGLLLGLRAAKDFAEEYVNGIKKSTPTSNRSHASLSLISSAAARTATKIAHVEINVRGDSDLIIKQMNGQYQCKNAKLIPLYDNCRSIASQLKMMEHSNSGDGLTNLRVSIDISHVYRNENKVADALANEAMDERRSWRTEFVRHINGDEEAVEGKWRGEDGVDSCKKEEVSVVEEIV